MTTKSRFTLITLPHGDDTYGWNGYVLDRQTNIRHHLTKTVVDYVLDGEIGYVNCAFDTKAEMLAAAQRKARKLLTA